MNIRAILLAAAFMMCGVSSSVAAETHTTGPQDLAANSSFEAVFEIVTGGSYHQFFSWTGLTYTTPPRGSLPTLSVVLYNAASEIIESHAFGANPQTALGENWQFFDAILAPGTYYADIITTGNLTVSNANYTIQAVPGPEAGAGLAGLVLAGMGAYVVRRRRQQIAA